MLSKVPEITVWFWIIKILCTTVGESFADWINMTLGVGLNATALIFTVVFVAVLGWQLSLNRYVPFVYWLTVVIVSVTGTLYTDILTDDLGVPLALSTGVFAAALAVVFGVWWARERTLSIHSIITTAARVVLLAGDSGHLRPGHRSGRLDPGTHRLGTRHVGAPARRPDRRRRDRLAPRRQRCAVLLAGLHPDPPTGGQPR